MIPVAKTDNETSSRLAVVFQELLSSVPPGAATIETERTRNDDGTIFWLKPSNKRAAMFSAHIEDGNSSLIDVSFGSTTTFELPTESCLPDDADFTLMLDTVKAMGLAVITGNCREHFGFFGIRGTLQIGEQKPLTMTDWFHMRPLPGLVRYEPYVEHPNAL